MNIVMLTGRLSSEPTVRELASGSVLVSYELTTQVDDASVSVPLVWFDPPKMVNVGAGDEITAVGTVRRRFYRAGGVTQSRTEVVVVQLARLADKRAAASQRRWVESALGATPGNGLRSS